MINSDKTDSSANLPLVHSIRGVAAFYVVVYHAKFILWSGGKEYLSHFPKSGWNILEYLKFGVEMLFSSGSQMVMIFFVLSGFFMAMSMENNKVTGPKKLKIFYSTRFIRIYVPYISSIVVSVLVLFWVAKYTPDLYNLSSNREFNNRLIVAYHDITIQNFLKSLVFSKNNEYIGFNYAYWSLLYEGIFYLIIPFIHRIQRQYFILSGSLFLLGIFVFSFYRVDNIFLKFTLEYNFYFAIGQAIYYYRKTIRDKLKGGKFKWILIAPSVILFFLFNVLTLLHYEIWADLFSSIAGGLILLLFLNYNFKNTYFIKCIKNLGKISYSLYLIHIPVLIFTYSIMHKITGGILYYSRFYFIAVFVCILCGFIFYKLAEEPSLALIKKVKNSFKGQPANKKKQQLILKVSA